MHGNKVKSFNWTLSTCTALCPVYITGQQVTPRRSNVYVSSELSFFFILAMNIREFRYFCSDVTFAFFVLVTCCTAKGRIHRKLVEIIHISANLDSSLRRFATSYNDRVPVLAGVYLRRCVHIHFEIPGGEGERLFALV